MKKAPGTWLVSVLVWALLASIPAFAQDEAPANILAGLPGQIAYIGSDFNVYTISAQGNGPSMLTDDAGETSYYEWPTWSTDGRLAYFRTRLNEEAGQVEMDAYVSPDGGSTGETLYTGVNEMFNYAYWSPENCAEGEDCRDLAILLSSQTAGGLFVELVRDNGIEGGNVNVGIGGPFYYSWSPDGTRMMWQRNNRRIDIYDVVSGSIINTLPQPPGPFQAPAWSPIDDRLLFVAFDPEEEVINLVSVADTESQVLASDLSGPVAFAWSPDGNKVAYTDQQGAVIVVDAITAEVIARSNVSGVFAFFWSPDSNRIAYITLASPSGSFTAQGTNDGVLAAPDIQQPTGIAWSVLEIEDGATRRFGSFLPTRQMLYLLVYFDQFGQSHRVWSPDSRYLLYSEMTDEEQQTISILDTSQTDTVPISIAEGMIAVWSFN
ncbi:MAG: PD40 domain-containing protein [Burkholderiales bacterium]|nr:PD40 domain-containing protein [Anaerolineae bacterium]